MEERGTNYSVDFVLSCSGLTGDQTANHRVDKESLKTGLGQQRVQFLVLAKNSLNSRTVQIFSVYIAEKDRRHWRTAFGEPVWSKTSVRDNWWQCDADQGVIQQKQRVIWCLILEFAKVSGY